MANAPKKPSKIPHPKTVKEAPPDSETEGSDETEVEDIEECDEETSSEAENPFDTFS